MSALSNRTNGTNGQAISCSLIGSLALGLAVLLGIGTPGTSTAAFAQAVVYDLNEINGDVRILGDERYDYVGAKDSVVVFDFNDNGLNDLFLIRGGNNASLYGFLDLNFDEMNIFIDTRKSKADIFLPYNIEADFVFDRLMSLDMNGDGVDDLITSSMNSYLGDGSPKVFVIYGSSSWQPNTTIDLATDQRQS